MIRRPSRARWCIHVSHPDASPGFPDMPNPNTLCWRRIGWWRSWLSEHCRQHDATPLLRHRIGYWLRPYDDHLDARRWRWQQPGCWRASRAGRAMAARLTKLLGDQAGGDR